jgi:hypothetical protein
MTRLNVHVVWYPRSGEAFAGGLSGGQVVKVTNSVTRMGLQFPGSKEPGEARLQEVGWLHSCV